MTESTAAQDQSARESLTAGEERLDEAELLGALLLNGKLIEEVRHKVEPRHFHDPHFGGLFALFLRLETITLQTALEELAKAKMTLPGGTGWATTLSECLDKAIGIDGSELPRRAARIRARSVTRRQRDLLIRMGTAGARGDDLANALDGFTREVRELTEDLDRGGVASEFLRADRSYLDLMNDPTPRPESVFGDGLLYPRQIGEIHGADGSRKSYVSLHLLAACATSTDFFGIRTRASGLKCGLISLEDDKWLLQARLLTIAQRYGLNEELLEQNFRIICPPYFDEKIDVTDPNHQAFIRAWIAKHSLELVVIDHLSRAHNQEDERDLRPVGEAGIAVARPCTCAIIFDHHDRKPAPGTRKNQDDPGASRGDSRFGADCRLRIALKETGENRIKLTVHKSTSSRKPVPIWLEHDDNGALKVADPPERSAEAAAAKKLRMTEAIRQAGEKGMTPGEVGELLALSGRQVRDYARELEETGRITRTGKAQRTRYYAPGEGPAEKGTAALGSHLA